MGTSKGYEAPTTPQWSDLKRQVTQLSGNDNILPDDIGKVINGLINALGGTSDISSGGSDRIVGASAISAGKNLSSFISSVATQGFEKTIEEHGLQHLKDQNAGNIIFSLLDELCGDGSSIDEVDVRNAMYDLEKELLEDADSFKEVNSILNSKLTPESLDRILFSFFGYYLFHIFERVFHERISQRKGEVALNKLLLKIKTYIKAELQYQTADIQVSKVNWQSNEGQKIIESVLQQTLLVFGR